jgi:hypothetical protein
MILPKNMGVLSFSFSLFSFFFYKIREQKGGTGPDWCVEPVGGGGGRERG